MMGFGFVVARFGLFLREVQAAQTASPIQSPRISLWFGTVLVVMGAVVNASAAVNHRRLIEQLRKGTWSIDQPSRSGEIVALALAVAGIVVAAYLLVFR
jgi:putative membrane protein